MPTLTRENHIKWNKDNQNNFKLDVEKYVVWDEKELTRWIVVDENNNLKIQINYTNEYKSEKNDFGQVFNCATGKVIPIVSFTIWHRGSVEGIFCNSSGSKDIIYGEATEKKNYKKLQIISASLTDEKIKELYSEQYNKPLNI